MKELLTKFAFFFQMVFFDPLVFLRKWLGLPYFFRNMRSYKLAQKDNQFPVTWRDIWYGSYDRFSGAGGGGHYFFQDIWAARKVFERAGNGGEYNHVDVGSRIDGFIAHLLPYCKVTYIDIRPLPIIVDGLEFKQGSILNLPFEDNSCETLSLSLIHI